MKRIVSLIAWIFLLFVLVRFPPVAYAACIRGDTAASCPKDKPFFTPYTLTYPTDAKSTNPFQSNDPSCTHPVVPSGTKTGACCKEENEANAKDSIRAPLCGASAELDVTNSTCWNCGGLIACSGYDQALGETTASLKPDCQPGSTSTNCQTPGSNDPIGEDSIYRVWRPKNRPTGTFMYNGIEYYAGGKDIIMCGPNLPACMQPACSNMIHPEVQSSGGEGTAECSRVAPVTGSASNTSSCQETGDVDLTSYVAPNCDGGSCEGVAGSAFPNDAAHVGNVNNQGETVTINGKTYYKQKSNGQHLLYEVSGNTIKLVQDTTWTNSIECVIGGKVVGRAVNRPSGATGAGVVAYNTKMQCGEPRSSTGTVQGYLYDPKIEEGGNELDSLTPCDISRNPEIKCDESANPACNNVAGDWGSTVKLIYQGSSLCMGQSKEITVMQVSGGGGAGEVFVYCKDQGLCAWYQGIDFSKPENSPAGFGTRDMCAGGPVGGQCVPREIITRGQTVHQIPLGQTQSILASLTDPNSFVGSLLFSWLGVFKPANDQLPEPELEAHANWLTDVGPKLTTGRMQRNWTHDTTPQYIQGASNLCVYDIEEPGKLLGNRKSIDVYSVPAPWNPPLREYGTLYNSLLSRQKIPDMNFNTESTYKLDPAQAFECGTDYHSQEQQNTIFGSTGQNTITDGGNPNAADGPTVGQRAMTFLFSITDVLISLAKGNDNKLTQPATDFVTHLDGNMEKVAGNIAPLSPTDLDVAVVSDTEKQNLISTGGFTQSYLAGNLQKFDETTGDALAAYTETITGQTHTVPARYYLTKRTDDALVRFSCAISPGGLQTDPSACDVALSNQPATENVDIIPTKAPTTFGSIPTTTTTPPPVAGWNCNSNAAAQSVSGLNVSGGKDWADNHIYAKTCKTQNAWDMCHNDVIIQSKKTYRDKQDPNKILCVDPIFTLAIWLHESAASNYVCGRELNSGASVQDFGYNVESTAENFQTQLASFLKLPQAYARCPKTMQNFIAQFWFGPTCYNDIDLSEKAKVNLYIDELNKIYDYLAPGVSLPVWPETTNCSK